MFTYSTRGNGKYNETHIPVTDTTNTQGNRPTSVIYPQITEGTEILARGSSHCPWNCVKRATELRHHRATERNEAVDDD